MIYNLWPEDGLNQRPKHVVSLNKTTKKLSYDLLLTNILLMLLGTADDVGVARNGKNLVSGLTIMGDVKHKWWNKLQDL